MNRFRFLLMLTAMITLLIPTSVFAFSASPAFIDIEGDPGKTAEGNLIITNNDSINKQFYLRSVAFNAKDDSGVPEFMPTAVENDLSQWIYFPTSSVSVPANSKKEVGFKVAIPSGIAAGGYHAAIIASEAPQEIVATGGVSLNPGVAVLVFFTVKGEVVEKLALLDFDSKSGWNDGIWEMQFKYRVQNQGNANIIPAGTIMFTDIFNRPVYAADANPRSTRVLPSLTRTIEFELLEQPKGFFESVKAQINRFAFGPVKAELRIQPGFTPDDVLIKETTVWIFPWQLLLVVAVVLSLVFRLFHGVARRK